MMYTQQHKDNIYFIYLHMLKQTHKNKKNYESGSEKQAKTKSSSFPGGGK